METHTGQCEIKYFYQKVREQQQEIEKLSATSNSLLSMMKKQIQQFDCENPEKFNRYAQIYHDNQKKIKTMKMYTHQLKQQTLQLQNRLYRSNTIKNFGLLGYIFAFVLKIIEKISIESSHEEIISFIIYSFIGLTILGIDWIFSGIEKLIIKENSMWGFMAVTFSIYFVVFGLKRIWQGRREYFSFCYGEKKTKKGESPGWILNP